MDLSDGLGSLLPFLIFTVIVVLGNLSDRKKPKVKKKGKPFPKGMKLPDIQPPTPQDRPADIEIVLEQPVPMPAPELPDREPPAHRPHHPDEYEAVHNSYQQYLERKNQQDGKQQEDYFQQATGEQAKPEASPGKQGNFSLAQAIMAAEILGRPKALQRRHR